MMRVRIYLSNADIKDACRKRRDFESDVEISPNDVMYISAEDLLRLIKTNPEYIPIIRNALNEWGGE